MNKLNLMVLLTFALVFNACGSSTAQKNEPQLENSKVAATAVTPSQVPESSKSSANNALNQTGQKSNSAQKFDCVAEIRGTGNRQIEIPSELCFDAKRPVDKSEAIPDPPRGVKQANTLFADEISVREVPPEVLQVIEAITGHQSSAQKFSLIVSSNGEYLTSSKRPTKMYLYSPITDDNESGTFYFQKQKGKMKLVLADM